MAPVPAEFVCIVSVAIPIPVNQLFDYSVPEHIDPSQLHIGVRLRVPFGNVIKIGILMTLPVISSRATASKKLKALDAVLDAESLLFPHDIQLLLWASRYYYHPIGEVMSAAFPLALRKGHPAQCPTVRVYRLSEAGIQLDPVQLKRAPKQQQLLTHFQTQPLQCLSDKALALTVTPSRATVNALIDKGLLIVAAQIAAPIPQNHDLQAPLLANPEQQHAIEQVRAALQHFRVFLLEGITGSGKTEVYMHIISTVLAAGQQVLVLLPEITLTPQLEARFKQRFNVPIAISHSRLTDTQRQTAWLHMQQGVGGILLGTRSALFTPLKNPGLIILDEEHDSSFKQQDGFRFSARDVAIMRAKRLKIPILLGSATPSFESLENAVQQRYQLLPLPSRAGQATEPHFLILDIRNKKIQEGLSAPLLQAIKATLAKNEQVLIFLNRRGYAPTLICHSCGWVARCQRCDANLVTHYDKRQLRCHHCGDEQPLLQQCPACKKAALTPLGLGTERIEKVLQNLFPAQRIIRLDQDTTQRKGALEDYLGQINRQEVDIILGTQMLAKGHHFPNVTLVALLDVDSGLFSIDFHAPEKLAQLIVQVAGRAGRADKPGKVILQTRQPDHPLLLTLIREGYQRFAEVALRERKDAALPPFSYQALLRALAMDADSPLLFLQAVCAVINAMQVAGVLLLGPVSAPMAKRAGRYHYQLLLQADRRVDLRTVLDQLMPQITRLREAKKVRWSLDIDPVDLY
ncbi:MAG: primosomal protein N' [Methylococcales bacterium]|nr:primosomal protein N' [Methylococcales bacterium]